MSDLRVVISGGEEIAQAFNLVIPPEWLKVTLDHCVGRWYCYVFLRNNGGFYGGNGATQQEAYDACVAEIAKGPKPQWRPSPPLLANLDIGKLDL